MVFLKTHIHYLYNQSRAQCVSKKANASGTLINILNLGPYFYMQSVKKNYICSTILLLTIVPTNLIMLHVYYFDYVTDFKYLFIYWFLYLFYTYISQNLSKFIGIIYFAVLNEFVSLVFIAIIYIF